MVLLAAKRVVQAVYDDGVVGVVADFSVSVPSPASAHLEEVDPVLLVEPWALGQVPSRRERREQSETVVQPKARRTVVAEGAHEGPLFSEIVCGTDELANPGRFADAVARPGNLRLHVQAVAQKRVVGVVGRQAVTGSRDAGGTRLQGRVTCNDLQLVLVLKFLGVGQGVFPLPCRPLVFCPNQRVDLAEFRGRTVGVTGVQRQVERWEEDLLGSQGQIHVHRGTELQVGQKVKLSEDVAHKTVGGPAVVGLLDLVDGVDNVAVDVVRVSVLTVRTGHRCHRVDVQRAHHRGGEFVVHSQCIPVDVGEGHVLSHLDAVARLLLGVDAEGGPLKASLFPANDAVLREVARTHGDARRLRAVRVQHAVVGHRGALEHGFLPVGAFAQRRGIRQSWKRGQSSCGTALVHQRGVLFSVQQRHVLPRLLHADVAVVSQGRLAATRALLRGDQHHTVGPTCTVNGGGCSVLQDADALDVRRVQVVNAT